MLVLEEKVLPERRAEAISAVRSSRISMAKTRVGVTIGRYGIVNGGRRFEIVTSRRDRIQCGERCIGLNGHLALESVIDIDENVSIEYNTYTGNSGWTNKSEIFTLINCHHGCAGSIAKCGLELDEPW
jgi:hypothetical protein